MDVNTGCSDTLSYVIKNRRSTRAFKDEIPPKELIEDVIEAGLFAPYAAQAVGDEDYFRKFFVISRNSPEMKKIVGIAKENVNLMSKGLKMEMEKNPYLKEKAESFLQKLELFKDKGVIGIGTSPYFIVVAEKKGFPPVEQQSLAHCLQNMWLKATSLNLGFQLVSATSQLENNEEFCRILSIKPGEYGINGCAVGYPYEIPSKSSRPNLNEVITWIC